MKHKTNEVLISEIYKEHFKLNNSNKKLNTKISQEFGHFSKEDVYERPIGT